MPSAPGFRHQLHDVAILQDDVMGGYFGGGIAELPDRCLVVAHACVMQDNRVRQSAALAFVVVRRRPHLSDDTRVWAQFGHKESHARHPLYAFTRKADQLGGAPAGVAIVQKPACHTSEADAWARDYGPFAPLGQKSDGRTDVFRRPDRQTQTLLFFYLTLRTSRGT